MFARTSRPRGRLAGAGILIALGASGCHLIEADVHNLGELHDQDGSHRYSGALEGEIEYFWRHEIGKLLPGTRISRPKAPEPIEDPSTECFALLIDLADYDSADPAVAGKQVLWFTRIAADDPWRLSRERAVIELGKAGERLGIGLPEGLPEDAVAAGPEALSEVLAGLASSVVASREGGRSSEARAADVDAATRVIEGLTLDVDGARRALEVAVDLSARSGRFGAASAPLERLVLHLERTCVREALARAAKDGDPRVRAAAVEASVRCGGRAALAAMIPRIATEPAPVAMRILDLVERDGLPSGDPDVTPEAALEQREEYLDAIYHMIFRKESDVRVHAMQALCAVSGSAIASLREEDWQAWWRAESAAREAAAPSGGDSRDGGADPVEGSPEGG